MYMYTFMRAEQHAQTCIYLNIWVYARIQKHQMHLDVQVHALLPIHITNTNIGIHNTDAKHAHIMLHYTAWPLHDITYLQCFPIPYPTTQNVGACRCGHVHVHVHCNTSRHTTHSPHVLKRYTCMYSYMYVCHVHLLAYIHNITQLFTHIEMNVFSYEMNVFSHEMNVNVCGKCVESVWNVSRCCHFGAGAPLASCCCPTWNRSRSPAPVVAAGPWPAPRPLGGGPGDSGSAASAATRRASGAEMWKNAAAKSSAASMKAACRGYIFPGLGALRKIEDFLHKHNIYIYILIYFFKMLF